MNYEIVFDVAQQQIDIWDIITPTLVFGVIITLVGIGILVNIIPSRIGTPKWAAVIFCLVGAVFSFYLASVSYLNIYRQREYYFRSLAEGTTSIVEGCVMNYTPRESLDRGPLESFSVNNITFEYNGSRSQYGFHETKALGGPIRAGLYVRINYIDNVILRIEIAEEENCEP